MKSIKLTLLALPLFVMADNPVAPADMDASDQNSSIGKFWTNIESIKLYKIKNVLGRQLQTCENV